MLIAPPHPSGDKQKYLQTLPDIPCRGGGWRITTLTFPKFPSIPHGNGWCKGYSVTVGKSKLHVWKQSLELELNFTLFCRISKNVNRYCYTLCNSWEIKVLFKFAQWYHHWSFHMEISSCVFRNFVAVDVNLHLRLWLSTSVALWNLRTNKQCPGCILDCFIRIFGGGGGWVGGGGPGA